MLTIKYLSILVIAGFLLLVISGCSDKAPVVSPVSPDQSGINQLNKSGSGNEKNAYQQVSLVSDISGFSASRLDPNLQNAWGLAVSPSGRFWISANGTGLGLAYDAMGNQAISPVTIPTVNNAAGGTPSGVVFNFTNNFRIPKTNGQTRLIFAGEDGIISVWGPSLGTSAVVAADQSGQSAVYKGIEIAIHNGRPFLYATNFKQARIDVFDSDFKLVSNMPFVDNDIPAGFAPFNIKRFHGQILVTYAKQKAPDNKDDEKGPGNGFIDVFTTGGKLIKRFVSNGPLNSPWGITLAPDGNHGKSPAILIGNFGDGSINMFGLGGKFLGPLLDTQGKPVKIDGLWAIRTVNEEIIDGHHNMMPEMERIYFTAGPDDENHGLFGYLQNEGIK
ncbi:MAG: TIGR03118 family protein [Ignavibacteria bacterium]|jgi:uncharacterized protein (TIGR03118 family)|nr:TIGR03118 family protein [Ignavibacteria bacterium]